MNLKTKELHKRAAAECFTATQSQALTYIQGTTQINIEKSLNTRYGNRRSLYDEETYLIKFSEIVEAKAWLIDELADLQKRIAAIKNPAGFYEIEVTNSEATGSTETKQNSEGSSESINKTLGRNAGEVTTENKNKAIARSAATETSKLHKDLEKWDTKTNLTLETTVKVNKQTLTGDLTSGVVVTSEPIGNGPEESEEIEKTIPYNQVNYSSTVTGDLTNSLTSDTNLSESLGDSKNKSALNSEGKHKTTGANVRTSMRIAEANLRALQTEIPNIRRKFYALFDRLYTRC